MFLDPIRCFLTVICRAKRFHVTLLAQNLHCPEQTEASKYERECLQLLHAIQSEDEIEYNPEDPDPLEAIFDWVVTPFLPIFQTLPPQLSSTPQMQTLYEYFNPPTLFFTLKVVQGKLTPIATPANSHSLEYLIPSMKLPPIVLDADLPTFQPSNIYTHCDLRSEGAQFPTKVFGDHLPYFYKATSHGRSTAIEREIDLLLRLERTGLTRKIRIPKLCGYVKVDKKDKVMGLLLTYIEYQDTLQGILRQKPDITLRKKWFFDIENMLRLLHETGIVLGDAKADNILIDNTNEVWMIDFGEAIPLNGLAKRSVNLSKEIWKGCRESKSIFR
ncbi:6b2964ed-6bd9-4dc1-8a24-0f29d21cb5c2 [Sclerotinia trifoliorum]|uniref:6b2964ed-6bd9-4dc1-8a24-0f29d21cb5c2 n=1 Tax=Sclerotinia trifoliorum TaxID=28548 RepID=A0A8H2VMS9_9HELO|nr:6b2964ed-6bd9-4dc1-8a24-0f29d21cb5c2 [Sclerotinia trifoliorum]